MCCSRHAAACAATIHGNAAVAGRLATGAFALTSPAGAPPTAKPLSSGLVPTVPGEQQRAWMASVVTGATPDRTSAAVETTAQVPGIRRLQQAAQKWLVDNGGQQPLPEQLLELRELAAAVPLSELGFSDDLVRDPSQVDALLRQQETRFSRPHPFLRGSVTYLHLHSCADYSLGIFMIPRGSSIPLHDHPGMTVISHLLFGSLLVRAFDPLPQPASPSSSAFPPGEGATPPLSPPSWGDHITALSSSEDSASPPCPRLQQQQQQQQALASPGATEPGGSGSGSDGPGWAAQVAVSISSRLLGFGSASAQRRAQQQQQQQQQQQVEGQGSKRGWGLAGTWAGVEAGDDDEDQLLQARLVVDQVVTAPCPPMMVHPERGNIHEFVALTHCAVLDLLTPPYSDKDGRDCTYFREVELEVASEAADGVQAPQASKPRLGDEVWLQVVQSEFYTKSGPYMGVRVD